MRNKKLEGQARGTRFMQRAEAEQKQ